MIRRLDGLIHQPWLKWVPRLLTGWVCDLYDHHLGMTWDEIRRTRHGKQHYWQRYWGFSQVRTFSADENDLPDEEIRRMWDEGEPVEFDPRQRALEESVAPGADIHMSYEEAAAVCSSSRTTWNWIPQFRCEHTSVSGPVLSATCGICGRGPPTA